MSTVTVKDATELIRGLLVTVSGWDHRDGSAPLTLCGNLRTVLENKMPVGTNVDFEFERDIYRGVTQFAARVNGEPIAFFSVANDGSVEFMAPAEMLENTRQLDSMARRNAGLARQCGLFESTLGRAREFFGAKQWHEFEVWYERNR